MDALSVHALRKVYGGAFGRGGRPALAGVDLRVPLGSAFGLIGLNGAGKTTFIKCLLGVVRPSGGDVMLLGGSPEEAAVRARVGYLPERLHLPGALTSVGFLTSVARLKGLGRGEDEVLRQLERVGLAEERDTRIKRFSKGMRQRLGLAAALLGGPELLVLDEPTDGVDPLGRIEVRRLLAEERTRGATIFLNSHLLSETERICDRVGILAAGRLVREGALAELSASGTAWRARFAPGAGADALRAAGFVEVGPEGTWRVEADGPDALGDALTRAAETGARLVELVPDQQDLEHILAESVGGEASA